jgi:type VI secretion system protein ImpA
LQAWNEMAETLDGLAGADGPSTGRVRGVLEEILDVARRFAPAEAAGAPVEEAVAESETEAGPVAGSAGVARGSVESREDMLRQLIRIAEFFRRTEPHSPLSYTLDEAVRRGRLSLPDLLEELVPDAGARGQILTQLGIRMPKPE